MQEELIDRFGKLPDTVKALVETHRLRIAAKTVGIVKIDAHGEAATLQFMRQAADRSAAHYRADTEEPPDQAQWPGQAENHVAAMPDLAARVTQIKTAIKQLVAP